MSLEVIGLRKTWGDFSLSIDMSVGMGETLALVGPSGSGKSTALNLIAGLAEPDSGKVISNGKDISGLPCWKRNISIVFQDLALFPHLDVKGNIAYGLAIQKISKEKRRQIVDDMLKLVRLPGYESRRIDTLSGGERQRVAIARSLATSPQALLLDEPFSSLDAPLRKALNMEFLSIRSHSQAPCIFVTHDKEEAVLLGDRIAVMSEGVILETGTGRDIILEPKNKFTARFFGAGQVLPCKIIGKRNAGIEVSSPLGILIIPIYSRYNPLSPKLFIPHDAVHIDEFSGNEVPDAAGTRKLRARYINSLFDGRRLILNCLINPPKMAEENDSTVQNEPMAFEIISEARIRPPSPDSPLCFSIDQSLLRFVE